MAPAFIPTNWLYEKKNRITTGNLEFDTLKNPFKCDGFAVNFFQWPAQVLSKLVDMTLYTIGSAQQGIRTGV